MRDVSSEEKRKGEEFSDFMKSFHEEVKLNLEKSNKKYTVNVDKSKRHHVFEVGDEVMIHFVKVVASVRLI